MRQFDVGQVVNCMLRHAAPGDYRIIAVMPDRDGDHMYRVKSPREEHERVVNENCLIKSDGYLPDEPPARRDGEVFSAAQRIRIRELLGAFPAAEEV
jgi:hypothetical protein